MFIPAFFVFISELLKKLSHSSLRHHDTPLNWDFGVGDSDAARKKTKLKYYGGIEHSFTLDDKKFFNHSMTVAFVLLLS